MLNHTSTTALPSDVRVKKYNSMRYTTIVISGMALFTVGTLAFAADNERQGQYVHNLSQSAPQEFKELLATKEKMINLALVNGGSLSMPIALGYYQVKLLPNYDVDALNGFLAANGLNKSGVEEVIAVLRDGIQSSFCQGEKASCIPEGNAQVSVVIDYGNSLVRLFVDKSLYSRDNGAPAFVESYNPNSALINDLQLYTSYFDRNTSLYVNDNTVLGLPYGNIRSDLYFNSQRQSESGSRHRDAPRETSLDVNSLVYDLEFSKYRLIAGRSSDFLSVNSTSQFSFYDVDSDGIYFMTSRNLAEKKLSSYQRVYFYMPQKGIVELYRDNQLLSSLPMEAGQQYISYEDLPAGNYILTMKLKANDQLLSELTERVVNTQDFALNPGDYDLAFGVSRLRNSEHEGENPWQLDANLMYRVNHKWMIGVGGLTTDSDQLYKLGMKWLPVEDVRLEGVAGWFSDGARYYSADLGFNRINFNYNRYDGAGTGDIHHSVQPQYKSDDSFSGMLMGSRGNSENYTLSTSHSFGRSSGYININYQDLQADDSYRMNRLGVNLGMTHPFLFDSSLGWFAGYNRNLDEQRTGQERDNYNVSLNWSIPLGRGTSFAASAHWNSDHQLTGSSSLSKQYQLSDASSVSVGLQGNHQAEGTEWVGDAGFSSRQERFQMNGTASASSEGRKMGSLNLSGAQIVTSKGIYFSERVSDSYLVIENPTLAPYQGEDKAPLVSQLKLGDNNQFNTNVDIRADQKVVVLPLDKYTSQQVKLDSKAFGYYNASADRVYGFTYPGSVLQLETDFRREHQLYGAFYLPDGRPVNELQCIGSSCGEVEKLFEGVFNIHLFGNEDYRLVAGRYVCTAGGNRDWTQSIIKVDEVICEGRDVERRGAIMLAKQAPVADEQTVAERETALPSLGQVQPDNRQSLAVDLVEDTPLSGRVTPASELPPLSRVDEASIDETHWRFGVFRNKNNAETLRKDLISKGWQVYLKQDLQGRYQVYGALAGELTVEQRAMLNEFHALVVPTPAVLPGTSPQQEPQLASEADVLHDPQLTMR